MARAEGPVDALGLRFIIGYKYAKAAGELVLGAAVLILASAGLGGALRTVALNTRDHATEAWSVALAQWLMHAATDRNLRIVALASLLDAAASLFEGWALHRHFRWSRWLVVGATASLLPFEVVAIVRHWHVGRLVLIIVNASIVVYLVWRVRTD
jgi:uncharacterized membrane protein (DUF2068 family)